MSLSYAASLSKTKHRPLRREDGLGKPSEEEHEASVTAANILFALLGVSDRRRDPFAGSPGTGAFRRQSNRRWT